MISALIVATVAVAAVAVPIVAMLLRRGRESPNSPSFSIGTGRKE